MHLKIGVLMDPIEKIKIAKDTSFALMLAAQAKQWSLHYFQQHDLCWHDGKAQAHMQRITVQDNPTHWFNLDQPILKPLTDLDVILVRKDPPVDQNYIYMTYFLDHAEKNGVLIVNKPQSLREVNEKFYITHFPDCIAPTLISSQTQLLKKFIDAEQDTILKPLHGMGGEGVFRVMAHDPNINVIIETLTHYGQKIIMAQRYIPEIKKSGDKRILMIDGEPYPHALARMPQNGETRANLAAGGFGIGKPLTLREQWICQQVGPFLKEKGLLFVGLDVIGDYLTEINVTSPTCLRELDAIYQTSIADMVCEMLLRYRLI